MNPKLLRELADRCEREKPSWQLDDVIAQAAWGLPPCGTVGPTPYTFSLDAAVELVPAGAWRETNGPRRYLNIPSPVPNYWRCEISVWEPTRFDAVGWGATEGLAICAAALKARAAIAEQTEASKQSGEANP